MDSVKEKTLSWTPQSSGREIELNFFLQTIVDKSLTVLLYLAC